MMLHKSEQKLTWQKIRKMILVKNPEDKKYRICGFFTLKEYEKKIERAIDEFNETSDCRAVLYDVSTGRSDEEMARILHEGMDLIGFKCTGYCNLPGIKDCVV